MALIQDAQRQQQTIRAGSFTKLFRLKIGAKVILTANLDIQDHLKNGQTGNVSHTEFAQVFKYYCIRKVYTKFSGLKAGRSTYIGTQNIKPIFQKRKFQHLCPSTAPSFF